MKITVITGTALLLVSTSLLAKVPAWMLDPTLGGKYTAAVGCASKRKNEEIQRRVAILNAKSELASQKNVDIESEVDIESDMFSTDMESFGTQKSDSLVVAVVKAVYRQKDGSLCVWMVEEKKRRN